MNATKNRPVKQRSVSLVKRIGRHALLEIKEDGQPSYYLAEEIPVDFGTAGYNLEKEDGTRYDVLIDEIAGHNTCDCPGHVYHGSRTQCKHIAALLALRKAGRLPAAHKAASLVELGRDPIPGHDDKRPTFGSGRFRHFTDYSPMGDPDSCCGYTEWPDDAA